MAEKAVSPAPAAPKVYEFLKDVRGMSVDSLKDKLFTMRKDLINLRIYQTNNEKPWKPSDIQRLRKDIARVLTVITEKQNQAS
eukprot:CAMPEP_0184654982 /NCGR_PEP_ID=MMETSP0308-20130426/12627_1 /TAXON_ID=38269 /ORGANISM="Gloeochaete witrockiana, Strain SAG 46.84" /LENGTH=82 /DNA_ID=CAMNT_0027091213 /DNA_START=106 /DNA_END=354 /DNA_ORIENTATION=+